jgi:hypothetical protein
MSFTLGILLIALTVGMVLVARPTADEPVSFLKTWFVGQMYVLGAMVSALAGGAIMINTWPF